MKCHCGKPLKQRKDSPRLFDCGCGSVYALTIVKKVETIKKDEVKHDGRKRGKKNK